MTTTISITDLKRFRVYLKGLHVGVGVRAERIDVDGPSVFFWNGYTLVASFWRDDITRVDESDWPVALQEAA